MNFSVNYANAPAFKGLYVVNGEGYEVKNYKKMMSALEKQGEELYGMSNPNDSAFRFNYSKTTPNGIFPRSFGAQALTGLYDDNQKEVKLLVVTDEDCKIYDNWYCKYGRRLPDKISISDLGDDLMKGFAEYSYAKSSPDREREFISEKNIRAKNMLKQLKEFTNKEIKIFNYKEIMEAIMSNKFNPVTGVLKTKL